MNLQQEICAAFCDGLTVRTVPVGYAVSTPVTWFSGDTISFYVRAEGERARLEDSGSLLLTSKVKASISHRKTEWKSCLDC